MSSADGVVSLLNVPKRMLLSSAKVGVCAALPSAMCVVRDRLYMVTNSCELLSFRVGEVGIDPSEPQRAQVNGPVDAVHIHRRFGIAAIGGKDNDLSLYDILSDRNDVIFRARNVQDHILGVPFPVYITGVCVVSSFVSAVCTAYHQVRFYDRRASQRPVQEFAIDREVERRPTSMIQWNCNKFLIGEASGDVHLYDTRRGFASRAKLRGGVGSVRHMAKHPTGHQLLGVAGLDRKVRLYHVPTGKLLLSLYAKQRVNCLLLDRGTPLEDNIQSYAGVVNKKVPGKAESLGDDVWDSMDPVCDEFEPTFSVADASAQQPEQISARKSAELRKALKRSREPASQ
jgi:ribosome biogenesis protein NSA1